MQLNLPLKTWEMSAATLNDCSCFNLNMSNIKHLNTKRLTYL